jgi:hypothetical protein
MSIKETAHRLEPPRSSLNDAGKYEPSRFVDRVQESFLDSVEPHRQLPAELPATPTAVITERVAWR